MAATTTALPLSALCSDFQGEELAQIRAYANGFKEQIKAINIQRALINEEQRTNDCDYVIPESATAAWQPRWELCGR